jgi:hypothetical protein
MRVLILYHAGFTFTPTVFHYLDAFRRHSQHQIEYFNIDQHGTAGTDFSAYDCLFVNFCVSSVARIKPPPYFRMLLPSLCRYRGLKIASVQDEYDFTDRIKGFFAAVEFDVILTNVPEDAVRIVYPEPWFNNTHFETVRTAYLDEGVIAAGRDALPLADRPIPLGYRGRELPYRLGDLGWHKSEVGRRFKAACEARGIGCDIAVDEKSRFHGDAWLDFVRNCRVMLGTPSGANVFDVDGSLHEAMVRQYKARPGLRYEDVRDEVSARAVSFDMGQVSARIFEAVASRTALALVRGNYSGVLEPDEHYVPIEPDYSNVDQALDRVLDIDAMQEMVKRAYVRVIADRANKYPGFVDRIDRLITSLASADLSTEAAAALPVTDCPVGTDPYLLEKLAEARHELKMADERMIEVARLVAENRLDVIAHPDGTYRMLKLDEPR